MGNQMSRDYSTDQSMIQKQSNNNDIKVSGLTISSIGNVLNDNSSYNGMVLDKSIINQKQINDNNNINYNSDKVTEEKSFSDINIKNSIKLYWEKGGNEVYITGSFCNWEKRFKMIKNQNNIFEQEFILPKGKYEFKFIVDGQWRCSSFYELKTDNSGNKNNFIDTTNININANININNDNVDNKELNNSIIIFSKGKTPSIKSRGDIEEMKKKYSNLYPYEEQLNSEAPKIPDVYEISMDLDVNSNQKYIGKEDHIGFYLNNNDESFKKILPPFHSYLNHLFSLKNDKNFRSNNKKDGDVNIKINNNKTYFGINCNVKVKNKYLSIIYYSPLNKT